MVDRNWYPETSRPGPGPWSLLIMKSKTRHSKGHKWRKRCDSSPVAKGRRQKIRGRRNPHKTKHLGGRGL